MLNHKLTEKKEALELTKVVPKTTEIFNPCASLVARANLISKIPNAAKITLLAAEHTVAHLIVLPSASARQHGFMMRFAVEEFIGASLESVVVSKGPSSVKIINSHLALVTSKSILDQYANIHGLFPEFLMVPPPVTPASWSVWSDGTRAVVRASDGTGFAVAINMLEVAWQNSGRPAMFSLAEPLPTNFTATDQSSNPPAPLVTDLLFRFANDRKRKTASIIRSLIFAGSVFLGAGVLHLAIFGAQTWALGQQVTLIKVTAKSAIATVLPNIILTGDNKAILARLAKPAITKKTGKFLPLLSDISRIITATQSKNNTPITFRRLAWGAQNNQLVLLLQAGSLDDLQAIQKNLEANGFTIRIGAANAGEGGANAEIRITRGVQQ